MKKQLTIDWDKLSDKTRIELCKCNIYSVARFCYECTKEEEGTELRKALYRNDAFIEFLFARLDALIERRDELEKEKTNER